jgi:integrase
VLGVAQDLRQQPAPRERDRLPGGAITALLAACGDNIRTLCAVLVGTGLRLDEALHLTWPDISLEHRTIAVQRAELDPALSPHDLRQTCASHYLAAAATSSSCRASWATRAWP